MDPLSITASIITVTGLAGKAVTGLQKLIDLRKAPNKVFELVNEISDLQATLHSLSGIRELDSESVPLLARQQLARHVKDASGTLLDLEKIIHYRLLVSAPTPGHEKSKVNLTRWVRDQHRIVELQAKVRLAKEKIQLDLTTVSAYQVSNLRIEVQDIALCMERADYQGSVMLREVQNLEQKINRCLQATAESQPDDGAPSTNLARQTTDRSIQEQHFIPPVRISADHYVKDSCWPWCRCVCHRKQQIQTPSLVRHLLGSLLVTYQGGLLRKNECNELSCKRKRKSISKIRITYFCPGWLISKAFVIAVDGPKASLAALRVRSASDYVFYHARSGNIQSLRFLSRTNKCSPLDVDVDGWSLLHFAAQSGHIDTYKGLLDLGADPDLQNRYSFSAKDLALSDAYRYRTDRSIQAWASVFDVRSWVEEQEFSRLHHIILDIYSGDLRQELEYSAAAINVPDVKGKTPLLWAARRGDNHAVNLLLEFGADPNLADAYGNLPILSCYELSVECLKELMVHGSIVKWYNKLSGATPLHYAAADTDDIQILEILLDAGADPMARDLRQWTPCHYAAFKDNLGALVFLIEHGAAIEADTVLVSSLLSFAVLDNSHACLVYLLEAGVNVAGKDIFGRTILHEAAENADERTLRILASFELSEVDPNATFGDYTAEEWFYEYRSWYGMDPPTEALENAFNDLLFKVREGRERVTGNEDDEDDEGDEGDEDDEGDEGDGNDQYNEGADQDEVEVRIPGSWT